MRDWRQDVYFSSRQVFRMIGIRTDMNGIIATGHMMRCLSIAQELRKQEKDVIFLLADGQALDLLDSRGFPYAVLHTRWDDLESELDVLAEVMKDKRVTKLLVDSYYVTESYLRQLSSMAEVAYLDDLNAFDYPVHHLICYANYWEDLNYQKHYEYTQFYMGPNYAPLRSAFRYCKEHEIRPVAERLLLLSGGADRYDVYGQLLDRLDLAQYKRIDVICGAYDQKYEALMHRFKDHANAAVHQAVTDIEKYMQAADLAVSAGGFTLYELCACGTPAVSFSLADNQLNNVKKFHADRVIEYAGDIRSDPVAEQILACLERYRRDWRERKQRSIKMQQLADGRGAERIAEIL